MKVKDRVVVGWIDPGLVDSRFTQSLLTLSHERRARIDGFINVEGGLISRQRNELVKSFLDSTTAQWLLILDSDEQISLAAFDKLVESVHDVDRPVVAGLYFGTTPAQVFPRPVPHLYRRAADGVSMIPLHDYPADTLIEVDAAGTGCLLIHRTVLETIRSHADPHEGPDWCWFRDLPLNGLWLGEDFYFCRLVKARGFPIHAHTGAVLAHRRRYWLDDTQHRLAAAQLGGRHADTV